MKAPIQNPKTNQKCLERNNSTFKN